MRALVFVVAILLAAAPGAGLEGRQIEVFDRRGDRTLLGAHPVPPPDSSPESLPQDLFEQGADGALRPLARGVSNAAYAPDGAVLFVRGGALYELAKGETRLIAQPVLGDFAVDPAGQRLAVVRPDAEPDSWIELIDRSGRHLAVLTEPSGPNAWPIFSPDGEAVFFVSGRTGVYSWFGVGRDGGGLRQLTNRGPGSDVLGALYVPPPISKGAVRFLDRALVEYEAGDGLWRVDLETGRGWRSAGVQP